MKIVEIFHWIIKYAIVYLECHQVMSKLLSCILWVTICFFLESVSRSYTPIPPYLVPEFKVESSSPNHICFMVKKYDKGVVSTWLTSRSNGDNVTITRPLGSFSTKIVKII